MSEQEPTKAESKARARHLVAGIRQRINEIDAATYDLGESLDEIDELAADLDDALLAKVWGEVEPIYSALDGKTGGVAAENVIMKYLQQNRSRR